MNTAEYLIHQLTASAVGWVAGALTTFIYLHSKYYKERHK